MQLEEVSPAAPLGDAPVSSPPGVADFWQTDPANLPGKPLTAGNFQPPPRTCRRYMVLLYFVAMRAYHLNPKTPDRLVINVPELMAGLKKSKRWIYRAFHTLAAFGLLYATPVQQGEGLDRRRYRTRLWLRVNPDVPAAASEAALRNVDDSGPQPPGPFPKDADWVARSQLSARDAAADAVAREQRASGRPASVPVAAAPPAAPAAQDADGDRDPSGPVGSASLPAPLAEASAGDRDPGAPVPPAPPAAPAAEASPGHAPVSSAASVPGPRVLSDHLVDSILPDASAPALRRLFRALAAQLGVAGPQPDVVCRVDTGDGQGIQIIERNPDFRRRAAVRAAYRGQHGTDAELPMDLHDTFHYYPGEGPDAFVPPDSDEFRPGKSGWRFLAGCWHAPHPVCRCTSREVAAALARMVLQPLVPAT